MVIDSGIASNPGIVCCYCRFSFFGRQLHNAAPNADPFFSHRKGEWSTNEGGEFRVRATQYLFCVGIERIARCIIVTSSNARFVGEKGVIASNIDTFARTYRAA